MRGPHTEKSGTNGIFISKSSPLKLTRRNEHRNDVIWITLFAALLRYIWSSWNLHLKAQMSLFTLHVLYFLQSIPLLMWFELPISYAFQNTFLLHKGLLTWMNNWYSDWSRTILFYSKHESYYSYWLCKHKT